MTVYLTNQVNNQRHKYHPLTIQYHFDSEDDYRPGCLKSVTVTNSSFQNYTQPDDHTRQTNVFLVGVEYLQTSRIDNRIYTIEKKMNLHLFSFSLTMNSFYQTTNLKLYY